MSETVIIEDRIDLPQSSDELFKLLTDIGAVAPCIPGTVLDPVAESATAQPIAPGSERRGAATSS
jgi:hypothetical protein